MPLESTSIFSSGSRFTLAGPSLIVRLRSLLPLRLLPPRRLGLSPRRLRGERLLLGLSLRRRRGGDRLRLGDRRRPYPRYGGERERERLDDTRRRRGGGLRSSRERLSRENDGERARRLGGGDRERVGDPRLGGEREGLRRTGGVREGERFRGGERDLSRRGGERDLERDLELRVLRPLGEPDRRRGEREGERLRGGGGRYGVDIIRP